MNPLVSLFCLLIISPIQVFGKGQYAVWDKNKLTLNNGVVERVINLPAEKGAYLTTRYIPIDVDYKYILNYNVDFQFVANDIVYSGAGLWSLTKIERISDSNKGDGASVTIRSNDERIEVTLNYLLYPNSPAIRKSISIKNLTQQVTKLESVDIEKFSTPSYEANTFSWIYRDYARRVAIGPYEGNMHDALVIVHNNDWQQGIVIGNEATGILKRTAVFWYAPEITTGLTHKNNQFPFCKWIAAGDSFETPPVFTMVYGNQKTPEYMLNISVPDFVRKHMGIRLSKLKEKPTYVYNTWIPFNFDINEKMIMELAKSAAAAGMKEFIIDDGWQDKYGDWNVDNEKFPNGLKPVFDYIKSLGMKPGIWMSIGTASSDSKVFREHPEWFILDKKQQFANIHSDRDSGKIRSACFSTGWKDYITKLLLEKINEFGIEYVKLDLAVVTSTYRFGRPEVSGCHAVNHSGHRDQRESFYTNYQHMWEVFDKLHENHPNLFIDCTFETLGGLQLIDYALAKHAEGNWLSNFSGPDEKIDLRIRNMAWWRSPAMPATALVIGNPEMQDDKWELHIKSIAGALPMMLGDPRQLTGDKLKRYRLYADWLQTMENKYQIMSFRQDLPSFGEPAEGMWDGFQRINTDSKEGGIIGIFRHGAVDIKRNVYINYLDMEKIYILKDIHGNIIVKMSGSDFKTKGFEVTLNKKYDGELYEISNDNR